ncbi:MAG: hypothetical protein QM523_05395 [Candidatus Pacebacteria bacterium]|nr:hypothetical protein [Candidatus Paceibacterota bacterium]
MMVGQCHFPRLATSSSSSRKTLAPPITEPSSLGGDAFEGLG